MEKTIEIPEGYAARIEGNKVILEPREGKDEIIRRALIELVSNDKANGYTRFYKEAGITCDDAIAYLERQKEQKPAEVVKDKIIRNRIIGYLNQDIEEHPEREERINEMLAYLERQKYEYEVFEPIESTLEYKAGFRAGAKEERKDLTPLISRLCEAILFEWKDAADLARKTLTQIKAREE